MAEEFLESDVFFYTNSNAGIGAEDNNSQRLKTSDSTSIAKRKKKHAEKTKSKSVPVNIPENSSKNSRSLQCDEEDGDQLVPPHVIVGRRRVAEEMALAGNGRVLKGREMSGIRKSVLKMTGFLEVKT